MRWISLVTLCVLAVACGKPAPAPPPFKAIADTKLLMQAVIDPAADVIWGSAGADITAGGLQELGPRTPEEWTHVRNNAVALAESGNLLMMAPRAYDSDEWMQMSQALVDVGHEALTRADARNAEGVSSQTGKRLSSSRCRAGEPAARARSHAWPLSWPRRPHRT